MLKPGDFVGPYEIRGFVGQGGMGKVYRAFDPRLERTIALKIINVPAAAANGSEDAPSGHGSSAPPSSLLGEFSARLLREARAVASLSHPNVVAIYDVGESDGRLYLAMEYVVGSSLRSFVGDRELPLPRRLRWLVDIARALAAAHKAGIVHRDIKPENVMVREDGGVKVLDFGIARRTTSRSPDEQHEIDTITGGGAIAGTPVYMAPEQIKGGDVDARTDQFAWGVLAYELVAGERPWPETGGVLAIVANVLTESPRSLRARVTDLPRVVEETILRALAKDPAARFASMSDAADALEPFASASTGDRAQIEPQRRAADDPAYAPTTRVPTTLSVAPPDDAEPRAPEARPRRRARAFAVPVLLLALIAGAVYVVKTTPGPSTRLTVLASPSVPRALSTVPQAETAYKDAMRLWHDGAMAKARAALASALALDPTFSAAHLQLALEQASANETPDSQASFQSAFEYRHMLLPRDERLLEASEPFIRPEPDLEEWETRLTSVAFQFPRDPEVQYYLGRAQQQQGKLMEAKAAFEAVLRLDEGFVPALAALAKVEATLGDVASGLARTEECLRRSPVASSCVQTRFELLMSTGECGRAKDEAVRWGTLEPQSPRPFARLARALHAEGAPRASIEEVLARRWSLLPAATQKADELWDRALLAIVDGDFTRADELAREHDANLPHTADSWDHARPARLRIHLLTEIDKPKEAAKVARGFLDRMAAWPKFPFAPDPSLDFFEPIYRAGEMTKRELEVARAEWLERERRRTTERRIVPDAWLTWAQTFGGFAETREEAAEALAKMPEEPLPDATQRGLLLEFALGKVYALSSRWDEAIPHLERVVSTCDTFDSMMVVLKARLYLGEALEARGDAAAARSMYEKIAGIWPKGTPSLTLKRASERLATLGRR